MNDESTSESVRHLLKGEFGPFFVGRSIDLLGSSMTTTALALAVLEITANPVDLGIVLTANMVSTLLLLLVGGAVADKYSQRLVLVSTGTVSSIAIGTMSVILLVGAYRLPLIVALAAVTGMMSAFSQLAFRSVVPHLVAENEVQRATSRAGT